MHKPHVGCLGGGRRGGKGGRISFFCKRQVGGSSGSRALPAAIYAPIVSMHSAARQSSSSPPPPQSLSAQLPPPPAPAPSPSSPSSLTSPCELNPESAAFCTISPPPSSSSAQSSLPSLNLVLFALSQGLKRYIKLKGQMRPHLDGIILHGTSSCLRPAASPELPPPLAMTCRQCVVA